MTLRERVQGHVNHCANCEEARPCAMLSELLGEPAPPNSLQIRLLRDVDFMGVLSRKGEVMQADTERDGCFAVQLGYGCFADLREGIDAERVEP